MKEELEVGKCLPLEELSFQRISEECTLKPKCWIEKKMGEEWTKEENTKTPGEILLRHKATHVQIKIQSKRLITITSCNWKKFAHMLCITWQNDCYLLLDKTIEEERNVGRFSF